jgi:hypothetical protein
LTALTAFDIGLVALVSIVAVGGVKLGYAYAAIRARSGVGSVNDQAFWLHAP